MMATPVTSPDVPRTTRRRAWSAVAIWIAVIWATIPFVRRLRDAYASVADPRTIALGVAAAAVLGAAGAAVWLWRRRGGLPLAGIAWLGLVATVVAWWSWRLDAAPVEAVHFVQYGVLGVLLNRAVRLDHPDASAFVAAALGGLLVGTVDEVVQWLVPERYWDLRDVALNGAAAALAQAALWPLWPPTRRMPGRGGARLVCALGAAWLLLMALCLGATPARTDWIVERFPGMAELRFNPIAEYGQRLTVPGKGEMRTRLPVAALEAYDATHAERAAALLEQYPPPRYGRFLEEVSPATHPFEYQARVHLFNRDVHLEEARRAEAPAARRYHATIAVREQQILERFYGRTLARTPFDLAAGRRAWLVEHHDPDGYVASRAGSHLLLVDEAGLRLALLLAAGLLLAGWWRLGRRPQGGAL